MYLNWQERLGQRPELRDFKNWPHILMNDVPENKRSAFHMNIIIVARVLNNQKFHVIASQIGTSKTHISRMMARSLAGHQDEDPPLTKALIPNTKIVAPKRHSALSTLAVPSGSTGSLNYLLEHVPDLRDALDAILMAFIKKKPESQNITPRGFFAAFMQVLSEKGWPQDQYPYTEKKQGCESVRVYMHHRIQELILEKLGKSQPKRMIRSPKMAKRAFAEIQIDEHTFDANSTVHIELDGELKPIRIARMSLLVAIDVATQTYLSYTLVLKGSPTQYDMLECLTGIYRPWIPKELRTPGLSYNPNSGFPCGLLFDGSDAPVPSEIRLDNAMIHIAIRVRSYIVDTLGSTYNLGLPATPKGRNWVEFAFKLVTDLVHRFASTSGTNPQDPRRESSKNAKKPPVISLHALEECIEVLLANHNGRPRAHLGGHSPLETMQYQLENHYIPRLTEQQYTEARSRLETGYVFVRHNPKEKRLPYINFTYCRYTGTCLAHPALINQQVCVHFNSSDIRKMTVYDLKGQFIGEVKAPISWQRFPHSMKTRQRIVDLIKINAINSKDPLAGYFNHILKNRHLPKSALELIRINREFTSDGNVQFVPGQSDQKTNAVENDQELLEEEYSDYEDFPEWTPELTGITKK